MPELQEQIKDKRDDEQIGGQRPEANSSMHNQDGMERSCI
jgi:hypothetical protein